METITALPIINHGAFQHFCCRLQKPVFTENNHILATVNIFYYQGNVLMKYWAELLLITHGDEYGKVLISEGDADLFSHGISNLLEDYRCEYHSGRSADVLVIEIQEDSSKSCRLDITEQV